MANDFSNYGTVLASVSGSSTTTLAGLIKLDAPAVKNPKIESTNHGSGGKKTYISGSLVEIDDFKGTFSFDTTTATTMYNACTGGTLGTYKITFPNSQSWQFTSLVTEFQPEGSDATSPELLQYSVTFSPSGSMVIT